MSKVIQTLKLSFNKESLAKKTSKKNELKVNSNSFLENNNKLATFLLLTILVLLTTISFSVLSSPNSSADSSASVDAGVNVGLACTLSGSNTSHAITLNNGSYNDNITGTALHTICNGSGNYNIYAIGYANNTEGNNVLDGGTSGTIPTGTTLDGTTSNWAMKLSSNAGNTVTIENGYSGFSIIPSTSTLVASYNASSNQTTDSTLQTTYGVSISPNQPAGTYTGQIKYTMEYIAHEPYIQDFTLSQCRTWARDGNLTVIDKRDGNDYTVRYINGACWMTQNLRFTGTSLKTTISNVDTNKTIAYGDLTSGNSYTEARIHDSGNTTTGVWYNFAAASAMYTTGNIASSSYDICPKNWHLPTGPFSTTGTDGYTIFQNTSYQTWVANASLDAFGAVAGGFYSNGSLLSEAYGYWWSATAATDDVTRGYFLRYSSNSNQFYSNSYSRSNGLFVRCVRTS